jgi:nucleoside-diphosphate-sugar epimerase
MRILVTGAAGFLGSHVVPGLLKNGHHVIAQDVLAPEMATKLKDCLNEIEYRWEGLVDIRPKSLSGVDFVLHFATQGDIPLANSSPTYTFQLNTDAVLSLLIALKETKTPMIAMSTENVYGRLPQEKLPAKEDEATNPTNSYSASKVAMEALCHAYSFQYGIPIGIIRSSTLFGERSRPRQVISIFARQALSGQPITIEGDGSQSRDFNYVSNMVAAMMKAIRKVNARSGYQVWNIGSGEETSIRELVESIIRISKSSSKIINNPPRLGEEGRLCMSIEKARKELDYSPDVSIEEGLKKTVSWMKAEAAGK